MPPTTRLAVFLFGIAAVTMVTGCGHDGTGSKSPVTYSIGGMISGLQGAGLVLQNNGETNLEISGNGAFSFANEAHSGQAYSVSIASHPDEPAQICEISNASGIVTDQDIGNLTVTCTNTHVINVAVSGLLGNGLMLQNNAADILKIPSDGDFSFAISLHDGASFNVTVLQQPSDPMQFCEIFDGDGTLNDSATMPKATVLCRSGHSVRGTTTGMSGGGLVLRNNGGNDLLVNNNGEFVFSNVVPEGVSYAIDIGKQPGSLHQDPNQTCTIYHGAGVMADQDVTAVEIDCVDNIAPALLSMLPENGSNTAERTQPVVVTFDEAMLDTSIIVSLESAEPSLQVKNSGGAPVAGQLVFSPLSNALAFTPDNPLELLESYVVTLRPNITDLAGNNLQGTSSYAFTVRDGIWQQPTLLEHNNTGTAWNPNLAVDSKGNALAVWRQHDGWRYNIWASYFMPATGWSAPVLIEANNTGTAWDPKVAMDASGRGIAVWSQHANVRENIWANNFYPDTGWGTPEIIELNDTGGMASSPEIAMSAQGKAVVVWHEYNGTRENIWANAYDPENGWNSAVMIEMDPGTAQNPRVAVDSHGNGIAIWQQYDGKVERIRVNTYTAATGNWNTAQNIESGPGRASNPQIAVSLDGEAFATWQQDNGGVDSIWISHYGTDGWGVPIVLESDDSGNAGNPSVALYGDGNAMVVWDQYDGRNNNVWVNRYHKETGWSGAELLDIENAGGAFNPKISIDKKGRALVVWNQSDGDRMNIWSNRYLPASGWKGATLLETDNVGNAINPSVVIDPFGNGIVVWRQWDGERDNIITSLLY